MEDRTMIRVKDIRERVQRSEYEVDARAVAEAILARLAVPEPAPVPDRA